MLSEGQMCFARLRLQAADRLKGCFRQFKARIGVIETEEINSVVCTRKFTISQKEQRVARDGLIKQLHRLHQIFFCPGAKRNAIDKVFGSQIGIVSNKIRRRRLLNGRFFGRGDFCSELICNLLRDLALEREDVDSNPDRILAPTRERPCAYQLTGR